MEDNKINGKKLNMPIYEELDSRLMSDDFRKMVLDVLEEVKPKRVFRFRTGKAGMIESELAFWNKVFDWGIGHSGTPDEIEKMAFTDEERRKKLEEEAPEGIWEFNGIGWEYLGNIYGTR